MNVSACLVTRGDVDMQPVLDSLPAKWEKVVWDNGTGRCSIQVTINDKTGWAHHGGYQDLKVYGRYAAIEHARHDLIYVQDDDCIVEDPQALVDFWVRAGRILGRGPVPGGEDITIDHVVCNMPQEFRPHYPDSGLVGFGACFHRDAPTRAFERFYARVDVGSPLTSFTTDEFNRRCDNVFTVLTPLALVDVPKTDREMASDPTRMWKQPGHTGERDRMIDLARKVRDA